MSPSTKVKDRQALEHLRIDAKHLIYDLLDVHLPIVCAVNGHAMGLGASVALLCDVIFMARSATIGCDDTMRADTSAASSGAPS